MKIAVASYHLPHPDGTATGRHVFAIWEAVGALGHDVSVWCWGEPPDGLTPPDWVHCERFHDPGGWRRKPATLVNPRGGIAKAGWSPPIGAVAWAEEPESYPAVAAAASRGVTVYHSTRLDAIALRRLRLTDVQSMRAERRAVRHAGVAITFSDRVAAAVGIGNRCPVTLPIPDEPLPFVADPVAVMIADWAWAPNRAALASLLRQWPQVHRLVPDARLLVAGRGFTGQLTLPGVEVVGEVGQASEVLSRAAVLAFPCPPTSGPKMKVLDALASGLPVVTTEAGVEGVTLSAGAVTIAPVHDFAAALAGVLSDEPKRRQMAAAGRADVLAHHRPEQAAAARLELIDRLATSQL